MKTIVTGTIAGIRSIASALAVTTVLLTAVPAAANIEKFVGKAWNQNGTVEYIERHRVRYENGSVVESLTEYFDPDNRKIGDLTSTYVFGPQFGSYDFRDIRASYADGAKVLSGRIEVFRKEDPAKKPEIRRLTRQSNQIVGQGFHQYIRTQLDNIARGEVYHVEMVLPSRLDQYKFRIRKLKIEGNVLSIRLEIDNWFLRLFAPYVDAVYDMNTRRLLRYEGRSNITDASGEFQDVVIEYSYHGDDS